MRRAAAKPHIVLGIVVTIAGLGGAFMAASYGHTEYGVVRSPAPQSAQPTESVADKLEEMHRKLAIRPEQEAAWHRYADAIGELDRSSQVIAERQPADATQRLMHALALNAAVTDLQSKLTGPQVDQARLLTDRMSVAFICKDTTTR